MNAVLGPRGKSGKEERDHQRERQFASKRPDFIIIKSQPERVLYQADLHPSCDKREIAELQHRVTHGLSDPKIPGAEGRRES
ncbi:Hypothetical predicted protein [Lynx pardinus]|uniref:Uncharacterized protein n=1 Tax=Lynx pardinus TaxID=191816 RepID=A0A485PEQ0_LYNPA|nr:Hypothetical predicted protein [Lynx pardinus]